MPSIDRLNKFAELLCRAIPDLDPSSLSPRPYERDAKAHVGRLLTREGEEGPMRVLFCVSEGSNFVPMAFVTCEDTNVAIALAGQQDYIADGLAPTIGSTFAINGENSMTQMGAAGCVMLRPDTLGALSEFREGIANDGEVFDPRLVVFLNAEDLKTAAEDLPALMKRFGESGRSVFVSPQGF